MHPVRETGMKFVGTPREWGGYGYGIYPNGIRYRPPLNIERARVTGVGVSGGAARCADRRHTPLFSTFLNLRMLGMANLFLKHWVFLGVYAAGLTWSRMRRIAWFIRYSR